MTSLEYRYMDVYFIISRCKFEVILLECDGLVHHFGSCGGVGRGCGSPAWRVRFASVPSSPIASPEEQPLRTSCEKDLL